MVAATATPRRVHGSDRGEHITPPLDSRSSREKSVHQTAVEPADRCDVKRSWNLFTVTAVMLLLGFAAVPTNSVYSGATANPDSLFTAAPSFCAGFTPTWMTGMEHGAVFTAGGGLFNVLTTTGGTVTADTVTKRTGSYSLKVADTNSGSPVRVGANLTSNVATVRFAVRFNALPTVYVQELFELEVAAGDAAYLAFNQSTNKLEAGWFNGTVRAASSTLSANTWYVIDLKADVSTSTRTLDWGISGVAQTQATRSTTATTFVDFTWGGPTNSNVFTAYVDDMAVTTSAGSYPIGDGGIYGLVPNSRVSWVDPAGDVQDQAGVEFRTDATMWNRVDEIPMTSTTDWLTQDGGASTAYGELGFADYGGAGCVTSVSAVSAQHSSGTATNDAKVSIFDGSTERIVKSGDMSPGASLEYYSAVITPATGTWNPTKLNGLTVRFGYATDYNPIPYWDALLLEYNLDA
jgi:hypothetical protein